MSFPTDLDTFTTHSGTSIRNDHAALHNQEGSAITATQTKLGVSAGSPVANRALIGNGNGTSAWSTTWNNATFGTPTIGTPAITGGTYASGIINTSTINNATIGTPVITGGTINGAVLGTPTIGTISVSGTVTALGFSAAIAPGVGSIADAPNGTLTANAQIGNIFYTALGTTAGNRTIGTPVNNTGYQALIYAFKASGSANGTLVWSSAFRFSDAGTPSLGTASTWNYYAWRYNAIDSKYDFQGQSKSII